MRPVRAALVLLALASLPLASCADEEAGPPAEGPTGDTATADTATAGAEVAGVADTVSVEPVDLADVGGFLVLRQRPDSLRLELAMTGLEPGARYLPNVHEGGCGGPMGAAVASLPPVTGAGEDTVRAGATVASSRFAGGRSYFLEVHGLGTAACVDLPPISASPE